MENTLNALIHSNKNACAGGRVASYIPGLERASKSLLGVAVADRNGKVFAAGDSKVWFTAQSIAKAFILAYLLHLGKSEELVAKIGLEPTGDKYNSLRQLDADRGNIPFNPMINAGAITATSLIPGRDLEDKLAGLLAFIGRMLEMDSVEIDLDIYEGERRTGNKNWAIAYMLKENNLVSADLDETMELYFKQCSILVRCIDLSRFGLFLLRNGAAANGEALLAPKACRLLKGVMLSCGLYTGAGAFAAKVGIPAKSGVSGGIAAVSKNYGIGVYGPALDEHGNSKAGMTLLEDFVDRFDESLL